MSHAILMASETPAANVRKQKACELSEALINGASLREGGGEREDVTLMVASCHHNCVCSRVHIGIVYVAFDRKTLVMF